MFENRQKKKTSKRLKNETFADLLVYPFFAKAHQRSNGGRRRVEGVHLVLGHHLPETRRRRVEWSSVKQHLNRRNEPKEGEREREREIEVGQC